MSKPKMKKRLFRVLSLVLCATIFAAFMPCFTSNTACAATQTITMPVYNQVIKSGKTVYCAGAKGIYKVKLKKGRVKSKKLIAKSAHPEFYAYTYIGQMAKVKDRIYYLHGTEGTFWHFRMVNVKTKKSKKLANIGEQVYDGYVIKGDKIYFDEPEYPDDEDWDNYYASVKSMSLDGKSKSNAPSVIPNMVIKKSNAKGYSVKIKKSGKYAKDYLKTPKGKFYLGKTKIIQP